MRVPAPASAFVDHPVRRSALAARFRARALLVVVAVVVAAAFAGLLRSRATAAGPTYSTVPTTLGDVGLSVSATGPVVALTSEPLNFGVGGRVADIPVEAGQTVHGGNVLARLDDSNLRLQFGQAQATLRQQQAALAKLQAGATPEQRQVAENQVEAAAQAVCDAEVALERAQASAAASVVGPQRNLDATRVAAADAQQADQGTAAQATAVAQQGQDSTDHTRQAASDAQASLDNVQAQADLQAAADQTARQHGRRQSRRRAGNAPHGP